MSRPEIPPAKAGPQDPRPAERGSGLRAYVSEDWFTAGIAEYLEAVADAANASAPLACLGCGGRFPRSDLWVHHTFDDLAYCDRCYYRRFGRQPA